MVYPPQGPGAMRLSELVIDAVKDWGGFRIDNVGAPDSDDDVPRARAGDILSGRFGMNRLDFLDISLVNLLYNGDFRIGDPPSGFTPNGSTPSQETAITLIGPTTLQLVCTAPWGRTEQLIADPVRYRGRQLTLGAWCRAPAANDKVQRIYLAEAGLNATMSDICPRDGAWHWLTAGPHTVDAAAAQVEAVFSVNTTGDADVDDILYISGAILVEGDTCPAFSPRPINANVQCIRSASLDLSGGATDTEVFHALVAGRLLGYSVLYTEASSGDAGVAVRVGRYQDGVALNDSYFDTSVSEINMNLGYSAFFDTTLLTNFVIAAGDTITVGTAGGKVGVGEVMLFLYIVET